MVHSVEVLIFRALRRGEILRFADLMRPTGLTSDSFKFYLRRLVACGWVRKLPEGGYQLTPSGKELANNLDDSTRTLQKQPKLSVLIVVERTAPDGGVDYLFQQRRRQPYYGRWGLLSGPVGWGESFEQAATRELHKQTGLSAQCGVRSFARLLDRLPNGELLEDKMFAVVVATDIIGELSHDWTGGQNDWLSLSALEAQPDYFPLTRAMLELVRSGRSYAAFEPQYWPAEY